MVFILHIRTNDPFCKTLLHQVYRVLFSRNCRLKTFQRVGDKLTSIFVWLTSRSWVVFQDPSHVDKLSQEHLSHLATAQWTTGKKEPANFAAQTKVIAANAIKCAIKKQVSLHVDFHSGVDEVGDNMNCGDLSQGYSHFLQAKSKERN